MRRREIAAFDVADEVEPRPLLEKLVRFLRHGVALLRLLADAEQSDRRDRRGPGRLAVDARRGARTDSSAPSSRRWRRRRARAPARRPVGKSVASGALDAGVQAEQHGGRGHLAPVLPAETNASDCPSVCRRRPTTMLELGLRRTAASGLSPMPMTSVAGTRCGCASGRRRHSVASSASIVVGAADQLQRRMWGVPGRAPGACPRFQPGVRCRPPSRQRRRESPSGCPRPQLLLAAVVAARIADAMGQLRRATAGTGLSGERWPLHGARDGGACGTSRYDA